MKRTTLKNSFILLFYIVLIIKPSAPLSIACYSFNYHLAFILSKRFLPEVYNLITDSKVTKLSAFVIICVFRWLILTSFLLWPTFLFNGFMLKALKMWLLYSSLFKTPSIGFYRKRQLCLPLLHSDWSSCSLLNILRYAGFEWMCHSILQRRTS